MKKLLSFAILAAPLVVTSLWIGCGSQPPAAKSEGSHTAGEEGHDHSGWWCDEHGMPEAVCAQCNSKLAAEFQKKGDWCKEHDRPESQCFLCHPDLEAKFAAENDAKEGKKPPQRKG